MTASLLRLAVSAAAASAVASTSQAARPCDADGGVCPSTKPTAVGSDNMLLQVRQNRSLMQVHRHSEVVTDEPALGFPATGEMKAAGLWCEVPKPPAEWNLKSCPYDGASTGVQVKVLTYNLFWWNLFDRHGGSDRSAGKLIAQTAGAEGYDLMGFQECDDRNRILQDALAEGLQGDWEALDGGHALGLMYRKDRFTLLAQGAADVGEDDKAQWYGKRGAVWVRLQHVSGSPTIFYINHHGPLPVSWGGGCTGRATAYNLLRVIANNAHKGDAVILTGDFNAEPASSRIQELSQRLHRVYTGSVFGGVDNIFSNCEHNIVTANLGKGKGEFGSDHDALSATFRL